MYVPSWFKGFHEQGHPLLERELSVILWTGRILNFEFIQVNPGATGQMFRAAAGKHPDVRY